MSASVKKKGLAKATVYGTLWSYAADYSGKAMVFITTIVLARLLTQEDYGVAGYALVVIGFLDVISGFGIGQALIYFDRKEDRTATAFWLILGFSLILFAISQLAAPWVGWFFKDDRAIPVTRVLAFVFPLEALGTIHNSLLSKDMAFGRRFIPEFTRSMVKGISSILLAFANFAAWSLIFGQLVGWVAAIIAFWIIFPWRPPLTFKKEYVRPLTRYGIGIVSVNVISYLLLNVDYLFVGRMLGASALGVYTVAFRVPELLIKQLCSNLARVVFPAYSKIKDDMPALRRAIIKTVQHVTLLTVPIGFGLALVAEPFVLVVFGDKWKEAIPVVAPIALYSVMRSLTYNFGDIYKARGRPGLVATWALVQTSILIPSLFYAVTRYGTIEAIGWTQVIVSTFGVLLDIAIARYILSLSITTIISAFKSAFIGGAIMALVLWLVRPLVGSLSSLEQLLILTTIGGITYLAALWWLQRDIVLKVIGTIRHSFFKG